MLTVVTGLPGAGKAAYVAEHKDPGDIVIDFDLIAEAIGSPVRQLQYLGAACRVVRLNPPPGGRRRRLAGRRAS